MQDCTKKTYYKMKMDIPEVPEMGMDETDAKAHERKIKDWKVFYAKQPIVTLITDKEELKELADELECELMDFAVAFPKSVHHLNDFKQNVPKAKAHFCFYKDGDVELCGMETKLQYDYLKAWKEIVLRCTGSGFTYFVAKPPKDKSELENAKKLVEAFMDNRDAWVGDLNLIDGVSAYVPDDPDYPDEVIHIDYGVNHIGLIEISDRASENEASVILNIDGSLEFSVNYSEHESEIHKTWRSEHEAVDDKDKDLPWLRKALIDLTVRMASSVPDSPYDTDVDDDQEEEIILDDDIIDKDKRFENTDINDINDPLN